MNTVTLKCHFCQKEFERRIADHNRSVKLKRREFCSSSCSCRWANANIKRKRYPPNADNRRDEFTSFRYFRRVGKARKEFDLSLEELRNLWIEQNGICPITGWRLNLPYHGSKFTDAKNPRNASLDRIDSSAGYILGNVRYIAYIANLAKNTWSDDTLLEFAEAIMGQTGIDRSTRLDRVSNTLCSTLPLM